MAYEYNKWNVMDEEEHPSAVIMPAQAPGIQVFRPITHHARPPPCVILDRFPSLPGTTLVHLAHRRDPPHTTSHHDCTASSPRIATTMSCSSPTIVFVDDLEFSAVKTVQLRIVDDVSVELAPADPEEDPTPIQYLEYLPAAVSRCTADNPCQVANVFTWGAHVILGVVEEASLGGCDLFADGGIVERIAIPAIRELDFIRERCCKTCCDEQCVELDDVLKDMRDHFCSEQLVRDCTGVVDLDNLPPSASFLPSYPYTEESSYCYISAADVFEDPSPNLQQQQPQHYPTHSDDDDDDVTGYYSSRCDISDDNDSIFDYAYDDGIDYSSSGSSSGNSSGSTGSSANPFYKQAGSITYQPSLDAGELRQQYEYCF